MSEGWNANSIVYNKFKGGEIVYKSSPDSLVQFISGTTGPILETFYWGKSSLATLSSTQVQALNVGTGFVGGAYPTPKNYIFPATSTYIYFAIPLEPSGLTSGNRVINLIRTTAGQIVGTGSGSYTTQQRFPDTVAVPPNSTQQVYYRKLDNTGAPLMINGIQYRLYRATSPATYTDINVYSIT